MSTRDLRVRFIGDAGNLKASFAEANAAAASVSTGMKQADVSANTVGKSFTRTSKIFKGAGKVIKSSGLDAAAAGTSFLSMVPALSGVASGMGAVTVAGDALLSTTSALGRFAIPGLGAAALAAGAAFVVLRGNASYAAEALERIDAAASATKDAHREVARAAVFQKRAVEDLTDAQLAQRQSSLGLWQAQHDLAEIAKTNGKNSLEYRQALLQVKQAEDAVSDARRETINQAQEVFRLTEKRSKATEKEKSSIAAERRELDKYQTALRLGFINGQDAARIKERMAKVAEAESKAANRAAARHRENARQARAAADAMRGDASPAAQELRRKLEELANTETDMSQAIAAMQNLASAAGNAAAGVLAAAAAIRAMPTTVQAPKVVGASSGGGRPAPNPRRSKTQDSVEMGRRRGVTPRRGELSSLGFDTVAGLIIDRRHRDDSLQDKIAERRGRAAGRRRGITNPDKLDAMAEKRVLELRKKEVTADVGTVKRQRVKLRQRVAELRKRLATQRGQRRKAKKDDQPEWDRRIEDTLNRIRGLWDQDRAMGRELAELQAEAKELGFDIGVAENAIAELPDAVPEDEAGGAAGGDTGPTAMDYAEAAVAEAALTPGTEDDLAAARGVEAAAQAELAAARASGDPRRIRDAANAVAAARAAREQIEAMGNLTDALNANTDAQLTGSSTFSYRGQDYVLRSLAPPSSDRLAEAAI